MDSAENLTDEDENRQRKTSAREKRNNQNESTSQKEIKKNGAAQAGYVKRRMTSMATHYLKILNS